MDIWSIEKRSQVMSRIRSKNTKPELAIRSMLHRLGFRFRLHKKSLPGSPDIVLARYRAIILVHGCFWHSHDACRRSKIPGSKSEYWTVKLEKNKSRDKINIEKLKAQGWRVFVIWECEINKKLFADFERTLINFLMNSSQGDK